MLKRIIVASAISPILNWLGRPQAGCYAAITGRLDSAGVFRRRPSPRGANAPHGGVE
jgi:hypothetical protein